MKVPIQIERSLEVPAPYAKAQTLLRDFEATIKRFPKLKRLKKLSDTDYVWEMDTIGSRIAKIAHNVSYGARYRVDAERGEVSWKPLPKQGNASIEGAFKLSEQQGRTCLSFRVVGDLYDVPVPLIYRVIAPAFIQGKFTHLVDTFLERTRDALTA